MAREAGRGDVALGVGLGGEQLHEADPRRAVGAHRDAEVVIARQGRPVGRREVQRALGVVEQAGVQQRSLRGPLERLGEVTYRDRPTFHQALKAAAKAEGFALSAPLLKTITSELGEQDDAAETCLDAKGNPEPDASLRDTENVPWDEDVDAYVAREVLPYAPDAWVDHAKTKEGAEIPFTRHFYTYVPPRRLEEIDSDLERVGAEIMAMLKEVEA